MTDKPGKPRKKSRGKYEHVLHIAITPQMFQFLHVVSERTKMSMNDLIREAIRLHLDEQEGIIGSRSRFASRVARQLEIDRQYLVRCTCLLLAAQLVPLINQGAKGPQVLDQVAKIAKQAEAQLRALVTSNALIADEKDTE